MLAMSWAGTDRTGSFGVTGFGAMPAMASGHSGAVVALSHAALPTPDLAPGILPRAQTRPIVAVLPYDPERRVCILIEAAGQPGQPETLEAISGQLVAQGPAAQARADAAACGGIELDVLEPVANRVTDDQQGLVLLPFLGRVSLEHDRSCAPGAKSLSDGRSAREIGFDRLLSLVKRGTVSDAKTLLLIQALMLRHSDLWARTV